jgi:hypothetical protein
MEREEVAFRIVRLYFEEIARLGFKRQLDLDQMISAYFYTMQRLDGKTPKEKPTENKAKTTTITTETTTETTEKK